MDKETLRKEHLKKMCEAGKISWEVLARELVDYVMNFVKTVHFNSILYQSHKTEFPFALKLFTMSLS